MSAIAVFAPAKINLSLRVGPPLADGRHPLCSLVAFTKSCGDRLSFVQADDLCLSIEGPFGTGLSSGTDNLIMQAAHLLGAQTHTNVGANIKLTKSLPVASGIGGGSADAAATLIGLNTLWDTKVSRTELAQMGASLGADVPACVLGQAGMMSGTGETMTPIPPLPSLGILLINPLVPCPTGEVYRHYDHLGDIEVLGPFQPPHVSHITDLLAYLAIQPNDLEAAACDLVPEIGQCLEAIGGSPNVLLSRMSGSGATCFGLYRDLDAAQKAAIQIKNTLAPNLVWVEADVLDQ